MEEQIAGESSSPSQINKTQNRLFFLDLLKALSMIAVVSYHSIFLPKSTYADHAVLLDALFAPLRFCVPVLLTISFLLFERGLNNRSSQSPWGLTKKRLIRLAIPTLFWFSLAAGLKSFKGNSLADLIGEILTGEIFTGAYYLLVMFQFVPIFIWMRRWLDTPRNIFATVLIQGFIFLFLYTCLCGVFGSEVISFLKTINRPLFIYWFIYPVLGLYFYRNLGFLIEKSNHISNQIKVLIVLLVSSLMIVEYSWLAWVANGSISPFDYATFSCILSVIATFLCFGSVQEKHLSLPLKTGVDFLSSYSLGIFCINGIISQIFLSFGSRWFSEATFSLPAILAIKLVGWGLLLAISLGLSILIDKAGGKASVQVSLSV